MCIGFSLGFSIVEERSYLQVPSVTGHVTMTSTPGDVHEFVNSWSIYPASQIFCNARILYKIVYISSLPFSYHNCYHHTANSFRLPLSNHPQVPIISSLSVSDLQPAAFQSRMQLQLIALLTGVSTALAGGGYIKTCKSRGYNAANKAMAADCANGSGGWHYTELPLNWVLTNSQGVIHVSHCLHSV